MTMQKENLKPLKFLVLSMGLVLVGGFVFLIAILTGKAGDVLQKGGKCVAEASVDLTSLGHPATTVWKDDVLRVMIVDPAKENSYRLITIDTCKGKVLTNVEVKTLTPLKSVETGAASPQ